MNWLPDNNASVSTPPSWERPGSRLSRLPLGKPRLTRAFYKLLCLPFLFVCCELFSGRSAKEGLGQDLLLLAEAWGLHGSTVLTSPALQGELMEHNLSKQLQEAIWCRFFSSAL